MKIFLSALLRVLQPSANRNIKGHKRDYMNQFGIGAHFDGTIFSSKRLLM